MERPKIARRDTHLRRERIVRAAVELYASDGPEVPLEKIADRAMVGRATLYRNFPDREALTEAVREHYLTELTAQVAQWKGRSDAFLLGIRALANLTIARSGFEKIVPLSRQSPAATKRVRARINDILAEPLIRAKAAGLVRADFEPADVQLAALMVAAGGLDYDRDTTAGIEKALELLMRGLAPESRQRTRPRS